MNLICARSLYASSSGLAKASRSRTKPKTESEVYGEGVIYVYPVPNSSYVDPGSQIIIRSEGDLNMAAISEPGLFRIVGTLSGEHESRIELSDDHQTVIIQPTSPFVLGESVHVSMKHFIQSDGEGPVMLDPFTFKVVRVDANANASMVAGLRKEADPLYQFNANASAPIRKTVNSGSGLKSVSDLPADFPALTVTKSDSPTPGYLFMASIIGSKTSHYGCYIIIADNQGYPIYYKYVGPGSAVDFKVQPTGMITYFSNTADKFYVMNPSLQIIDSIASPKPFYTDDHELLLRPDGHIFLLADDYIAVNMAAQVTGGDTMAVVTDPIIEELDSNKRLVFLWRCIDHFKVTDALGQDLTAHTIDFAHSNAIDVDNDGNLLLSSRHLSEITKININTGSIIWRLGGKNNQFTFTNDSIGFSYQHAIRRIPNGDLTLFDDGNMHDPPFSRAVEYSLNDTSMTATLVWQYRNTPDIYGFATGYVQRLSDGNTLIGWGLTNPTLSEVTPDGGVALEMTMPDSVWTYRVFRFPFVVLPVDADTDSVAANSNATVRWKASGVDSVNVDYSTDNGMSWNNIASNIPADSGAFNWSVPALPPGTVEYRITESGVLDSGYSFISQAIPVSGGVTAVKGGPLPNTFSLSDNYPNPFNPSTTIHFSLKVASDVTLDVFNVIGQKVLEQPMGQLNAGGHSTTLKMQQFTSGVYFYRLLAHGVDGENFTATKKLVLLK